MNSSKYDRILNEFERNHSDIVGHVVDWYPNGKYEVVAILDDGTRVIYNCLEGTARYIHCRSADTNELDEDEWRKIFAIKLLQKLRDKSLTQLELSEISGVSKISISLYVRGKALPSLYNLTKIANALNCDVSELVNIE